MIQYSTEPEYSVEEKSEKISQQLDLLRTSSRTYKAQVQVRSRLLYVDFNTVLTTLERIRDSLRELEQYREDT